MKAYIQVLTYTSTHTYTYTSTYKAHGPLSKFNALARFLIESPHSESFFFLFENTFEEIPHNKAHGVFVKVCRHGASLGYRVEFIELSLV